MPPDSAERLIDHALAVEWHALSAAVQDKARIFLHDTLAVGAAGRNAANAEAIFAVAGGWGDGGASPVLGRAGVRLPAGAAAFVNAFQIHAQEFDCVHEPAVLHPLATVLAAVLAELSRGAPASGAEMLAALVAGVDVAVSLGLAAPGPLRFFRPATAGIFGCVAAIARLRRMPRGQALDAMGHALAFVSGTMQAHVEGKPALPIQVAHAAQGALAAIDLARAGIAGVRHPLDGPFGYFALIESEQRIAPVLAELGTVHRIAELSWKPFPTGRAAHGGIVATQQLMAEGLTAPDLARLEYQAPPLIHRLVGRPATAAMAPGYARLCLPYLAAVRLLRGGVTLADFAPASLSDPATLALADRIHVAADGNADPAAFVPAVLRATLRDGRTLERPVSAQFGSPEWPLSREQHDAKARDCLAFAGLVQCEAPLRKAIDAFAGEADALAAIRRTGLFG